MYVHFTIYPQKVGTHILSPLFGCTYFVTIQPIKTYLSHTHPIHLLMTQIMTSADADTYYVSQTQLDPLTPTQDMSHSTQTIHTKKSCDENDILRQMEKDFELSEEEEEETHHQSSVDQSTEEPTQIMEPARVYSC